MRINQSNHFAVFNAMLASKRMVDGKIAVSTCCDSGTSIGSYVKIRSYLDEIILLKSNGCIKM
jgi:hypothetical protein